MSETGIQKTNPKLTITDGIAKKSAEDEHGLSYMKFNVNWLAGEEVGYCNICETAIEEGWLCLDGGEVYCYTHVEEVNR